MGWLAGGFLTMRRVLMVLWLGAGALAGPASAAGPVTVVLGDSLSAAYGMAPAEGWVERLAARVAEGSDGARVVNASISGDTTAGGLARLPALLERITPAAVLIFLGGNDGLRGISPAATRQNLEAMIALVRAHGAEPALIPVRLPPNYGEDFIRVFETLQTDLCARAQVPCLAFPWEPVALEPRYLQEDGLHPNVEAQAVILESLWPALCRWRAWSACAADAAAPGPAREDARDR
jgi:acyl-CoA thioesterase-1